VLEIEVTPFHAEVRPADKAPLATMPPGSASESRGDPAAEPREAETLAADLKDLPAQPSEPGESREPGLPGEPWLGSGHGASSVPSAGRAGQLDEVGRVDRVGEIGPTVGAAAESTEAPPRSSPVGLAPGTEPARVFTGPVVAAQPAEDAGESTSRSTSMPAGPKAAHAVTEDASAEGGAEAALSPLALTLAHMAEAMQPEFGYEATDDVEILEPPAANPAPEDAVPSVRSRSNTPPPVPRHARGVAQDRGQDRAAVLPAPSRPEVPEPLAERPRRPKRSKPWFEEIFDENYLRTLPFMTPQQTLREVDFLQATLNVQPGASILDVGCGYGRHAIELVQRGLAVTGLDLSLPLLIRAADESQRRNLVVDFVHGDMRHMAFERQFDAAYSMLTSFGYFDEESNLRVAEGIARALKPGGRLLLDVVNRDYVVGDLPTRIWWEGDGCVVLEEVEFNFNTNRLLTHRSVVFDDGRQLDQEISLRAYSLHDLGKLLRLAGFRILEVSGSIFTRGHYFGAASRNLIVLAERRAD
jgi:SAM-dependent methyltransferase